MTVTLPRLPDSPRLRSPHTSRYYCCEGYGEHFEACWLTDAWPEIAAAALLDDTTAQAAALRLAHAVATAEPVQTLEHPLMAFVVAASQAGWGEPNPD